MKYKPYPKYKDSGVEWLGEIPEGWEVKKTKHLVEDGDGGVKIGPFGSAIKLEMMTDSETGFIVFGQENVIERDFTLGKRFMPFSYEDQFSVYNVQPGDILVTMMGTGGRCCIVPPNCRKGIIDSHLMRIRLNNSLICSNYFVMTFDESASIKTQIDLNSKGSIMQGLNKAIVNGLLFPLPPLPTQRAIAAFLDTETARIDGLIKDYEELIELLKEKRQALISHAVTRGLSELVSPDDPEFGEWAKPVKLKDSGVEWIGEIPEGWEIICLKYISSMQSGDFIQAEHISDDGRFPVLGGNGLRGYTENYNVVGCYPLVGRQGALCGNVNYGTGRFWATEHAIVTYPYEKIDSKWLYWLLIVMDLGQYSTSAAQPGIAVEVIKNKNGPVPSLPTQHAIATFLDRETSKLDTLVVESQSAIELLKEHRSALITNAVTGKINVEAHVTVQGGGTT